MIDPNEKIRKVVVEPHNPDWRHSFQMEAEKLAPLFGDNLIVIHHIGSTAIPSIQAKPIVDMMPVVRNIELVDPCLDQIEALGYKSMGEYGCPGRRYFWKLGERTHHIHTFAFDSAHVLRHLKFRDYLNSHPDDAQKYSRLKQDLAARHEFDIESYVNGKTDFVKKIDQGAWDHFFLETDRLRLRPFSAEDTHFIIELNSDPEVTRYTGDSAFADEVDAQKVVTSLGAQFDERKMGRFVVVDRANGERLGWCGLRWHPDERFADLGYRFFRRHWGRGFATEASRACIEYGFNSVCLPEIHAFARPENVASLSVLNKLGFEKRGCSNQCGPGTEAFVLARPGGRIALSCA